MLAIYFVHALELRSRNSFLVVAYSRLHNHSSHGGHFENFYGMKSFYKVFLLILVQSSTGLSHQLILHSLKKSAIGNYCNLIMTLMKFLWTHIKRLLFSITLRIIFLFPDTCIALCTTVFQAKYLIQLLFFCPHFVKIKRCCKLNWSLWKIGTQSKHTNVSPVCPWCSFLLRMCMSVLYIFIVFVEFILKA